MRRLVYLLLGLVLMHGTASQAPNEGRPPRIVCYYTPGNPDIEDVPGDLCTNILYSFGSLNTDTWELVPGNYKFDIEEGGYKRFTGLKEKFPDLKTDLSFGHENFKYLVRYKERRDKFVASVVKLLSEYGFDGFDIDWEFPQLPIERQNYPVLIDELRAAFDAEGRGWNLSMAVPSNIYLTAMGYDVPALCKSLDSVNFMGYDLRSEEEGFTDVHSLLYRRPKLDFFIYYYTNVNDCIMKWVNDGCPRHKLMLGVPFYGRSFTLLNPSWHNLHAPAKFGKAGWVNYNEICKSFLDEPGWVREYDDVGLVPWAYKDLLWIGYEDADSLMIKMNYIREQGFGGAMNWRINTDDYTGYCGQGTYPLLRTLNYGLENYTVPVDAPSRVP
ncbi:endochitinase-like [Macrobrachium nipponense]|uniref:endochitinase-like n=1 Tax=Macrobrachium nipponense TaxID=159736 RepID=UPI0030C82D6B